MALWRTAPRVVTPFWFNRRIMPAVSRYPKTLSVDVSTPPFTATAVATPSSIAHAKRLVVNVHVALRYDTPGGVVRLDKVSHTGGGRERGWQLNTADVDGVVYAIPGVTYTLTYTITEPLETTAQARAKVVVGK